MHKVCKDCEQSKELKEFYESVNGSLGVQAYCKFCMKLRSKSYNRELRQEVIDAYLFEAKKRGIFLIRISTEFSVTIVTWGREANNGICPHQNKKVSG